MSAIFNFIRAMSNKLYGYVTTISFLTSPTYYKLKNAPIDDENSVHTINQDIHVMYEVPATMNVHRAKCSFSDVDSHFFANSSS
jgi:hypothetical protein